MEPERGPVYAVGAPYVEQLEYSNPFDQKGQPVWYRNERCFVLRTPYEVVWTDPPVVLPKEYVFRHGCPDAPGDPVAYQLLARSRRC
jgi:hypothetical protein